MRQVRAGASRGWWWRSSRWPAPVAPPSRWDQASRRPPAIPRPSGVVADQGNGSTVRLVFSVTVNQPHVTAYCLLDDEEVAPTSEGIFGRPCTSPYVRSGLEESFHKSTCSPPPTTLTGEPGPNRDARRTHIPVRGVQEQPLVVPQPLQTKQAPARCMTTPQT
jgi:hypothetical protein